MNEESTPRPDRNDFSHRNWSAKFTASFGGLVSGFTGRGQGQGLNSFVVHIPCAVAVITGGAAIGVGRYSMALLLICIGFVFVTELLNSSLELLAKAVTDQPNANVGAALDIASGAVLMSSLTAVVVGLIVFGSRVVELMGW